MTTTLQRILIYFVVVLFALSCSDYQLHKRIDRAPDIDATPSSYDYGYLNADGEVGEIEITISNRGNETLEIFEVILSRGVENFSVGELAMTSLDPDEDTSLTVSYDPVTYEVNYDEVIIISNDPDERRFIIPLDGAGDAPVIRITPEEYDFDSVYLGCEDVQTVEISNVGNVDLVIDDIDYYATLPVDMYPENFEVMFGPFPVTIPPGNAVHIELTYVPLDVFDDEGYFVIKSNDPMRPSATAMQTGEGLIQSIENDTFVQDTLMPVDVLFVIDNSGSMSSNQTSLATNFHTFMNMFVVSGADYHIAFITTDSPYFVGDMITPLTVDPVGEAVSQITSIGTRGSTIEKGFEMSYEATLVSGEAGPGSEFFRSDAKLVVIYISDEDDFSSSLTPLAMESHLRSLKSASNLIVAHAVAGDVPYGCSGSGSAQAGLEYAELVSRLSGTFLSICTTDWGTPMEALARDSITEDSFYLSERPIESTITVYVDGVQSFDWVYDSSTGAIVFSVMPREGATIDVSYGVWAC